MTCTNLNFDCGTMSCHECEDYSKDTRKEETMAKYKNDIINTFATAPLVQALGMIKAGFELETQRFEGCNYDSLLEGGYVDCECTWGYDDLSGSEQNDIDAEIISNHDLDEIARRGTSWLEQLRNEAALDYDNPNECECGSNSDPKDEMENLSGSFRRVAKYLEVASDATVEGPEIQCRYGGLSAREFLIAAKGLFKCNMSIDEQCSFHIHLSVNGVQHTGGENHGNACMKYLYDNIDKIPTDVLERYRNNNGNWAVRYFAVRPYEDNKYQAVAHRGKTWEFRLFGNISSFKDAFRCLVLAVKAMQYAYTCTIEDNPVKEEDVVTHNMFLAACDKIRDADTAVVNE